MKIAIRGGHNFLAVGAVGIIDETTEDRKVKDSVVKYLNQLGNEVLDVTPGNIDSDSDLLYGVSRANNWGADLFISIHFNKAYNSYNGAIGTETWVYSKSDNIKMDEEIAVRIVNSIAGLGFNNRGVKERTDLYELKATKMASIIVEVCFVEATEDVALYKRLGPDKIGQVIAEAISNKRVEVSNMDKIIGYTAVYDDNNGNKKIGSLNTGATVEVIDYWSTLSKIRYGNSFAYIDTSALESRVKKVNLNGKVYEDGNFTREIGTVNGVTYIVAEYSNAYKIYWNNVWGYVKKVVVPSTDLEKENVALKQENKVLKDKLHKIKVIL